MASEMLSIKIQKIYEENERLKREGTNIKNGEDVIRVCIYDDGHGKCAPHPFKSVAQHIEKDYQRGYWITKKSFSVSSSFLEKECNFN